MTLLVIDDEKSVHIFLEKCIGKLSLPINQIVHAYKGSEALEIIKDNALDLILLDIQMPGMNGIEFLQKLRNESINIPVIVLTAYSDFNYAKSCIKYGVTNYLLKPIDIDELHDALADVIEIVKDSSFSSLNDQIKKCISSHFINDSIYVKNSLVDPIKYIGFICYFSESDAVQDLDCAIARVMHIEMSGFSYDLLQFGNDIAWKSLGVTFKQNSFIAGISNLYSSNDNIVPAIRQSYIALMETFYSGKAEYYKDNYFSSLSKAIEELRKYEDAMQESYHNQNLVEILKTVELIFDCFTASLTDPNDVKNYFIGLLSHLDDNYWEACQLVQNNNLMHDLQAHNVSDLQSVIIRILISMLANIHPEHIRTDEEIIQEIKKYIDRHYDADLSLASMENHFYISRYQISRLFKKHFLCNYSNYILQVRMEAAKNLLISSDKKQVEIGQLVGYDDVSYFSNVFKKYYGLSPSDFKSKYKQLAE